MLRRDLRRVPEDCLVSMSNSSDPYPPIEAKLKLTRETLRVLGEFRVRVLIVSKSSLVVRDLDLLKNMRVAVTLTITTLDPRKSKIIEPNAPPPEERVKAVRVLSKSGVRVGVRIDPIIPYINDDPKEIKELVERVVRVGAQHITTSTFKAKRDSLARLSTVPGLGVKIRELYLSRGVRVKGYMYLEESVRRELLKPIVEEAQARGVTYATCREGFKHSKKYFNAPSCDGSHLIDSIY